MSYHVEACCPLKVSFVGGGTDIPEYFEAHGGYVVSAAISPGITVRVTPGDGSPGIEVLGEYWESREDARELENPIVRAALQYFEFPSVSQIEIRSAVPGGSGLGSSSALLCALVVSLECVVNGNRLASDEAAAIAASIEISRLGRPIGLQDHYTSVSKGVNCLKFSSGNHVSRGKINTRERFLRRFESSLLIFDSGLTRDAGQVISSFNDEKRSGLSEEVVERLSGMKALALEFHAAIVDENIPLAGGIMLSAWEKKRQLSSSISLGLVDRCIEQALSLGAYGGKLLGAGGGGHLLLVVPQAKRTRIIEALPVPVRPFSFSSSGLLCKIQADEFRKDNYREYR